MLTILALFACGSDTPVDPPKKATPEVPKASKAKPKHVGIFKPLPKIAANSKLKRTRELVDLGRMLYYDKRMSKNHDISCNSCHQLTRYGVDGEPTSPGHKGQRGGRNSPTTLNAALHLSQFWDGREPTVEAQAKGPLLNPVEMAMPSEDAVLAVLNSIPGYVQAFKAAFPDDEKPITYDHFGDAIGAFERGLMTPSRFDAYLQGDTKKLTDKEVEGLDMFVSTGCATCHLGPAIGGNMYQKLGLVEPYETKDLGRFEVTKSESDKYVFKVPSLRNITKTGPYFHDGSVTTLDEAITVMAKHQLGKTLSVEDTKKIKVFLGTLEGHVDEQYVKPPVLPGSSESTPAPDPS